MEMTIRNSVDHSKPEIVVDEFSKTERFSVEDLNPIGHKTKPEIMNLQK